MNSNIVLHLPTPHWTSISLHLYYLWDGHHVPVTWGCTLFHSCPELDQKGSPSRVAPAYICRAIKHKHDVRKINTEYALERWHRDGCGARGCQKRATRRAAKKGLVFPPSKATPTRRVRHTHNAGAGQAPWETEIPLLHLKELHLTWTLERSCQMMVIILLFQMGLYTRDIGTGRSI